MTKNELNKLMIEIEKRQKEINEELKILIKEESEEDSSETTYLN